MPEQEKPQRENKRIRCGTCIPTAQIFIVPFPEQWKMPVWPLASIRHAQDVHNTQCNKAVRLNKGFQTREIWRKAFRRWYGWR